MKRIIVTGSSGTVGTAVCKQLIYSGFHVFCVDSRENPHNDKIAELTLKIDLRNKGKVFRNLPDDVDLILHLAANARVPHSIKDPLLARDNFEMTFNLLEFARVNHIKNFLFASSKDVYGNFKTCYAEDDVRLEACESPYAASKIGCEALIHGYHKSYGMDYLVFRLSNVYGRYDDDDRMLPIFIRRTKAGEDITINGADKLLDFIYIDDVVEAILLCIRHFDRVKNQSFNIAYGEGTPLLTIAGIVKTYLKGTNNIIVKNSNPGDVIKSVSDISKAREELGFSPKTDIESGSIKAIEDYLNR